jgi:16S rRNA G1207 methylase RsmC
MPPRRRSDLVIPRETSAEESQYTLRVPDAEYLLLQHLTELKVDSVLCTSLGRGQLAAHLADLAPKAKVTCFFFDQYLADDTIDYHAGKHPRLQIVCGADLPDRKVELAALPVTKGGEAELTREVLHQMHDRLFRGGMLVAGVDNPTDTWLYHELEKIFRSIQRIPERRGIIYRCIKEEEIKRPRDPRCEFAFRDQGNLIKAVSRPGVFSHRHLDLGSRALLETMVVNPGEKVLDIGCGSGVIALACAQRAEGVSALGVDANARAVQCVNEGAVLNNTPSVKGFLDAAGRIPDPGTFDLAVGNPPYYSHYKIAEIFMQSAKKALKPGGRVMFVTKKTDWFVARMGQLFKNVKVQSSRAYQVVSAEQPK